MIKKLRWKFVLVMTAFSMAVLCLVLFFSFATMKNNIEQENEKTLKQIAEMQQVSIMGLPRFQTDIFASPTLWWMFHRTVWSAICRAII